MSGTPTSSSQQGAGSSGISSSPPSFLTFHRIACGAAAGAFTKTCIAPLERIKIIHQTQGMVLASGAKAEYGGIAQSLKLMLEREGVKSLWNGNGANVLRVIPNYGLRFSFNDKAREIVMALRPLEARGQGGGSSKSGSSGKPASLSKFELFLAGSLAGIGQITITYPAEVIFTRLALSGAATSPIKYSGILDCLRHTIRSEGPRALYNGYLPTILSGTPYVALQMSCYEIFQRSMPKDEAGLPTVASKLVAGAGAGIVAQTVTFPGDVVRKRMQSDGMGGKPKVYTGLVDAMRKIYQKEGIKGFFDGVKVNSWRCLPEGAIMFFTFDALKHLIGISQYDTR